MKTWPKIGRVKLVRREVDIQNTCKTKVMDVTHRVSQAPSQEESRETLKLRV